MGSHDSLAARSHVDREQLATGWFSPVQALPSEHHLSAILLGQSDVVHAVLVISFTQPAFSRPVIRLSLEIRIRHFSNLTCDSAACRERHMGQRVVCS